MALVSLSQPLWIQTMAEIQITAVTSGFVLKIGTGAVSWSSKLQTTVALSTTEAQYVAACYAGREVLWLQNLLSELGFESYCASSQLRMDNQSAISVAKNPEHHGRMKHLDLAFYWLSVVLCDGSVLFVIWLDSASLLPIHSAL
jgi:hypothetical protein